MNSSNLLYYAKLIDEKHVEVHIYKKYSNIKNHSFSLFDNLFNSYDFKIISIEENNYEYSYLLMNSICFDILKQYYVVDEKNTYIQVDCSFLLRYGNAKTDKLYSTKKMGYTYSPDETSFNVFAPLAKEVIVNLQNEDHQLSFHLQKDINGVFSGRIKGNFESYSYTYLVKNNGIFTEANDPYSNSLGIDSKKSYIIDPTKTNVDLHSNCLSILKPTEMIIYEMSIRDMTSFSSTNITDKGKYLGLCEYGKHTKGMMPCGIDYLKSLGITHVQIMPMYDFATVSDLNPSKMYNWGYDPLYYGVPEGSFSNNPSSPYQRIIELKKMISTLHENNIHVIMDVVFNHVFSIETNDLEKICPNYYFRYNSDGSISNGSFCGNEVESRHLMARKFILDMCEYWIKTFGIDGFRFDLMGLIDKETIKEVYKLGKSINPSFIVYGEGWVMPSCLPKKDASNESNAFELEDIGFFNARFRDIVKGNAASDRLDVKGYCSDDSSYVYGFKNVFVGSAFNYNYNALYKNIHQSINYAECHDDATIYDKLVICNPHEDEATHLRRIKLINSLIMFSFGVPLFHSGQEIGQSKKGRTNTYNSPDEYNQFNYDLLDRRKDMYQYFRDLVKFRKENDFFKIDDKDILQKHLDYYDLVDGALLININLSEIVKQYKNVKIVINPLKKDISFHLDDEYEILFNEHGIVNEKVLKQELIIPAISLMIIGKK